MTSSTTVRPLLHKLNHVKTYRYLRDNDIEIDYPAFSSSDEQEQQHVRMILFAFLKQKFTGSKIRSNANSFSLRLDGQVHKKASKLRQILTEETEWQAWFERHHPQIHRQIRHTASGFESNSYFRYNRTDDRREFIYLPFNPTNIYGFGSNGLSPYIQSIQHAYQRDAEVASVYEEATQLIEAEVQRRDEEKARLLREEMERYNEHVRSHIYQSATELQESEDPLERLFSQKFLRWAEENHMAPRFAKPIGPVEMVSTGLKVKVVAPNSEEEEGWIVLPPFEGHPELPAEYEFQGWGRVTSIDLTSERSRSGQAPVVVQEHLFTEFESKYWEHLLPENYAVIKEATDRLRKEAEEEIEPFLAEERERQELQERLERERQETLRQQEAQLQEQLRLQRERESQQVRELFVDDEDESEDEVLEVEVAPDSPSDEVVAEPVGPNASFVEALRRQVSPRQSGETASEYGLYHNSQAIPLEQYIAISESGTIRRFPTSEAALYFLGRDEMTIYNYHEPHDEVGRAHQ